MYVHVCTCVYMCVHVCTCVYMCVHVCTCVYMCVHVCACLHHTPFSCIYAPVDQFSLFATPVLFSCMLLHMISHSLSPMQPANMTVQSTILPCIVYPCFVLINLNQAPDGTGRPVATHRNCQDLHIQRPWRCSRPGSTAQGGGMRWDVLMETWWETG